MGLPLAEATDNRRQRRSTVLSDGTLRRFGCESGLTTPELVLPNFTMQTIGNFAETAFAYFRELDIFGQQTVNQ